MPATKAMDSARPGGGLVRRHRSNALCRISRVVTGASPVAACTVTWPRAL